MRVNAATGVFNSAMRKLGVPVLRRVIFWTYHQTATLPGATEDRLDLWVDSSSAHTKQLLARDDRRQTAE